MTGKHVMSADDEAAYQKHATAPATLAEWREGGLALRLAFRAGLTRGRATPADDATELEHLRDTAAALRRTLQFYADGSHYDGDEWEDVSGEPANFLCNQHGDTVEDGSIARAALEDPPRYIMDVPDPQEDLL